LPCCGQPNRVRGTAQRLITTGPEHGS
jgi:hypothetical protein